ncbi:MAG: hypothetical protein WBE14_13320, partial [Xanthobacteraceae bacterium]
VMGIAAGGADVGRRRVPAEIAQVNDLTSRDLPHPAPHAKNLDLRRLFAATYPRYDDHRIYNDQMPSVRPEQQQ